MMLSLGKLTQWLMGSAMTPVLVVSVLVFGGKYLEARRAELVKQGEQKCVAQWELRIMQVQRDTAIANAKAADSQREASDYLARELRDAKDTIEQELAVYRTASIDRPQCGLSDRVRELARGVRGDGGGQADGVVRATGQSGRAKAP